MIPWCRRYEGERQFPTVPFNGVSKMIFLRRLWKIPQINLDTKILCRAAS
jgi:hypothetical protein